MTPLAFDYTLGGLEFEGAIISGERADAPTVLVFHGMEGRSDAQVDFCLRLADLGYRAVAVDLFDRAATRAGPDACAAAMASLLDDRKVMRDRLLGVVDVISALPSVRPHAIAAIGFCFGGLCMLDLARHGAGLEHVIALASELTERGADWQLHAYGHALHAFMAPFANAPERGIMFDESTARRAWASAVDFLQETFG